MKEDYQARPWPQLWAELLKPGGTPLPPLQVVNAQAEVIVGEKGQADWVVEMTWGKEGFRFVVETATLSTQKVLEVKAQQARALVGAGEFPLVGVPFLAPALLEWVEREGISALDLCGNGLVQVPGRLLVKRSGRPNQFPDTRPLQNPFRGRSAMVARAFLMRPVYESLTALQGAIFAAGEPLSLPQVSKAQARLVDEALVEKTKTELRVRDAARLLDALARGWKEPPLSRAFVSVAESDTFAARLNATPGLRWAVGGAASVARYASFAQGGPMRLMVSNWAAGWSALRAEVEPVPSFADFELCQSDEAGFFFNSRVDEAGVRWASPIQTFLELQAGDARQQDAAGEVRRQILRSINP